MLFGTLCVAVNLAATAVSLSPDGDRDMTADVLSAVESVRAAGGGTVRLSEGRAAVVVRRTGASALPVRVVASSPGLREATLVLPRR
jgi:hypothetical protein